MFDLTSRPRQVPSTRQRGHDLLWLLEEFQQLTPAGVDPVAWQTELKTIAEILTETCRTVDPTSTEETIKKAHAVADVVAGEENAKAATVNELEPITNADDTSDFGIGILD